MTNIINLDRVNEARRRAKLQPLNRREAATIISHQSNYQDTSFDWAGFLIGYATGIPVSPRSGVSLESLMGSMLHQTPTQGATLATPDYQAPAADPTPEPSYSPPASDPSPSYDSGSSSSSFDSGSSVSSDSGAGSF